MFYEFIQATTDMAEEINALVNSAYRGESSKAGWTTEADLLDGQRCDVDTIRGMIEKDGACILIAQPEEIDQVDACVYLEKQKDTCYLGMLTVSPKLQGNGVGKQLLEEAEIIAQFWECKKIAMKVISIRKELIDWYLRHGYKTTDHTEPFPYGNEKFGIPKVQGLQFTILEKNI